PADSVGYYDVGDSLVQFGAPTMPLVKLSVGTDGKVTLEMPRLEQGQGIATALGMMIAEEMDVPLSDVIVHSADAQPELRYNQITGGSSSIRCFDPVLPVIAAAPRARLVANAKPTMLRMPSQIRGQVISVNNLSAVKAMPGVIDVVVVPPGGAIVARQVGVAVMAETFGQAWDACRALDITWGDGTNKGQSNE